MNDNKYTSEIVERAKSIIKKNDCMDMFFVCILHISCATK